MSTHQVSEELSAATTLLHRLQTETQTSTSQAMRTLIRWEPSCPTCTLPPSQLRYFIYISSSPTHGCCTFTHHYSLFIVTHRCGLFIVTSLFNGKIFWAICGCAGSLFNTTNKGLCIWYLLKLEQKVLFYPNSKTNEQKLDHSPSKQRSYSCLKTQVWQISAKNMLLLGLSPTLMTVRLTSNFPVSTTITAMRRQMVAHTYG